MEILIVVDMQKDFVSGVLGSEEAKAILPTVAEKIKNFKGEIYFTRDTHTKDYLNTQEGKNLPVEHCIKGTDGWQIETDLQCFCNDNIIDKPSFGSVELMEILKAKSEENSIEKITFIGVCTDICVISNAMMCKAFLPEILVSVDASCCAGISKQSHNQALQSMQMCQITIENNEV